MVIRHSEFSHNSLVGGNMGERGNTKTNTRVDGIEALKETVTDIFFGKFGTARVCTPSAGAVGRASGIRRSQKHQRQM